MTLVASPEVFCFARSAQCSLIIACLDISKLPFAFLMYNLFPTAVLIPYVLTVAVSLPLSTVTNFVARLSYSYPLTYALPGSSPAENLLSN